MYNGGEETETGQNGDTVALKSELIYKNGTLVQRDMLKNIYKTFREWWVCVQIVCNKH